MLELSCSADWDAWISFFAEEVAAAAAESRSKVEGLVAIELPYVNRAEVPRRDALSGQGAINAINTLIDLEILQPAFRTRRGAQAWAAQAVIQLASQ